MNNFNFSLGKRQYCERKCVKAIKLIKIIAKCHKYSTQMVELDLSNTTTTKIFYNKLYKYYNR